MIKTPLNVIGNKTISEAIIDIDGLIRKKERLEYVLVANINHLARIKKDALLSRVYSNASLVLPDGKHVYWLSRLYGVPLREYIRGLELFYGICRLCAEKHYSCLMVGGKPGAVEKAREILEIKYPGLTVSGALFYPLGQIDEHAKLNEQIIEKINRERIDILFLGLGTPREQIWIDRYENRLKCTVVGVGSVYDFISGNIKEAPRVFQYCGLEWLWRFIDEPRRLWKRYFIENMTFVFGSLVDIIMSQRWKKGD